MKGRFQRVLRDELNVCVYHRDTVLQLLSQPCLCTSVHIILGHIIPNNLWSTLLLRDDRLPGQRANTTICQCERKTLYWQLFSQIFTIHFPCLQFSRGPETQSHCEPCCEVVKISHHRKECLKRTCWIIPSRIQTVNSARTQLQI